MRSTRWNRSLLVAAALCAGAASASARTVTSRTGQVAVDLPNTWNVERLDKDTMVIATEPAGEAVLLFWIVDQGDVRMAVRLLDKEAAKMATKVRWKAGPTDVEVHGMRGIARKGRATLDGRRMHTGVVVLRTRNGKGLIVLGMLEGAKRKQHKTEMANILTSLRPAP